MDTMNLMGFSVEECVAKIIEQLTANDGRTTVASNDMATMREVARILGRTGCSCELWPAEGVTLFAFSRIETPT